MGFSKARNQPAHQVIDQACNPKPMPTLNAPKIIVSLSMGMPAAANANNTPTLMIEIRISRSQLPMPSLFLATAYNSLGHRSKKCNNAGNQA
jgi:hypothetical protein